MQLDGSFLFAEFCPVVNAEAKVDCRAVDGIERIVETELVLGDKRLRSCQNLI